MGSINLGLDKLTANSSLVLIMPSKLHLVDSLKKITKQSNYTSANPNNGFQGILGELFKGFSAFSDPVLMKSAPPPYDFSLS